MQARYYSKKEADTIACQLCPHNCLLKPGKSGLCRVRENQEGELHLPFYGQLSSVALDPIEKKPLYHFYPGAQILSVGFWGCNFRCPFCQNHQISQATSRQSDYVSPHELVELAVQKRSFALAYTYSEPLVHFEYIIATASLAKAKGIKNVLVSNGYINPEPATELLGSLDAANIDLKTLNPRFYKEEIKGDLEEVKRFLRQAAGRINLEVTTLVIPGKNDSEEEIAALAGFLAGLNVNIPLHLSCYYPTYQYKLPPTSPQAIFKLAQVAEKYLHFVYPGNIGNKEVNTRCPECRTILIKREGYLTQVLELEQGKCRRCGTPLAIPLQDKRPAPE